MRERWIYHLYVQFIHALHNTGMIWTLEHNESGIRRPAGLEQRQLPKFGEIHTV
jgi:hypothetical protein